MKNCKYIIGIAGGSGSGKTTFAKKLVDNFKGRAKLIFQDNYYIDQSDKFDFDGGAVNFDHPESIDFDLMSKDLKELKAGRNVDLPIYDFNSHKRLDDFIEFTPPEILVVDGILIFSNKKLFQNFDLKIFIEAPEELRFSRRLARDMGERGRTSEGVHDQFYRQVKPMHDQFVEPSRSFADHIYSGNSCFEQYLQEVINFTNTSLR